MIDAEASSIKNYLLTAFRENWNHFDKEYSFKKSTPKRIKSVIKSRREGN